MSQLSENEFPSMTEEEYDEMYTPTVEKTIENMQYFTYNTTTLNLEDLDVYELIHHIDGVIRDPGRITITYDELKEQIKKQNIKTIRGYGYWSRRNKQNLMIPSYEFDTKWTSWADLLNQSTFTYNEAKTFIKNNLDLSNVNNVVEWYKYFDEVVNNEYYEETPYIPPFINEFARLPTKPNIYYNEFVSYDDYLGKKLDKIIIKKTDDRQWGHEILI